MKKILVVPAFLFVFGCSQSIDYHPTLTDPMPSARGPGLTKTEVAERSVLEASGLYYGEVSSSGDVATIKWKVSVKNGMSLTREIVVEVIFFDAKNRPVVSNSGTKLIPSGKIETIENTFKLKQRDVVRIVRAEALIKG